MYKIEYYRLCNLAYAVNLFLIAQPHNDPAQMPNGTPSGIQQQSFYPAAGSTPSIGTGQQGIPSSTTNQQMIQRVPQQNDPHFNNQPIHHPMNQAQ